MSEEAKATAITKTKTKKRKESRKGGEGGWKRNHTRGDNAHVDFKTIYLNLADNRK